MMLSEPAALTLAKDFVEVLLTATHDHAYDYDLCKAMTVVSASLTPKPRAVTRLIVTPAMCNISGNLHGGAISTLFDVCTTTALATAMRKGFWELTGVTRTLNTTCLRPVSVGEEIEIEAEVAQIGQNLAHILGKMTLVRNGKLVATGVHDKVNIDPPSAVSGRDSKL